MPEVKTFVKEPGHADSYSGLSVNFISGKVPELVLFDDDDTEGERIGLSDYSTEGLHKLMRSKGFEKVAVEVE